MGVVAHGADAQLDQPGHAAPNGARRGGGSCGGASASDSVHRAGGPVLGLGAGGDLLCGRPGSTVYTWYASAPGCLDDLPLFSS